MNFITIDRIEEGYAVAELPNGSTQNLPLSQLPQGIREGSRLVFTREGWRLDEQGTADAQARVRGKLDRLLKKDSGT